MYNKKKVVRKKKDITNKNSLTPQQQAFVKAYVTNMGNGRRAYMECYPSAKMSAADASASRLLNNVKVKAAIEEEYKRIWKEKDEEIEKSKTYQMIHSIGNSNITDVVDFDVKNNTLTIRDLKDIPPEAREAIQSIKMTKKNTEYGTDLMWEIKLHPKLPALELRAKLQNMLEDKNEINVDIIIPARRPDIKDNNDK